MTRPGPRRKPAGACTPRAGRTRPRRSTHVVGPAGHTTPPTTAQRHPTSRHVAPAGVPPDPRHRSQPATTILCDIDVLLTFEPHVLAGIEERHGLPDGRLHDVLSERPTAAAASIGMLDQPTWLEHARQILPPAAVDEWLAYHGVTTQPVLDLLRQAGRAGCAILLTGNGTDRRADDLAHHQLTDLAAHVYLSARTGYAKPDPRAWAHALRDSRTDPARALAVEPRPEWARAARQLGLRAHHYTDTARLADAFARAGALP